MDISMPGEVTVSCLHKPERPDQDAFHVDARVHYLHDAPPEAASEKPDHYMLEVQITCRLCGEPMHFLGPELGIRFDSPTVDLDRTTINLPFVPGRATKLGGRFTFQLPPRSKT
jgi:hypothetical protein